MPASRMMMGIFTLSIATYSWVATAASALGPNNLTLLAIELGSSPRASLDAPVLRVYLTPSLLLKPPSTPAPHSHPLRPISRHFPWGWIYNVMDACGGHGIPPPRAAPLCRCRST